MQHFTEVIILRQSINKNIPKYVGNYSGNKFYYSLKIKYGLYIFNKKKKHGFINSFLYII